MTFSIPAIVLLITMMGADGKMGQAIAFPESMEHCNYIAQTMVNDETSSIDAEEALKEEGIAVEPRTKLMMVGCYKVKVPYTGKYTGDQL